MPESAAFTVDEIAFRHHWVETRFPFQYGIASMTRVPHLFVCASLVRGGQRLSGVSADNLPPKWFTKNPATTFEQDLPGMCAVIKHAAETACRHPAPDFFTWWDTLYHAQTDWAERRGVPPLLANFGTSLIERAVLDALCRGLGRPIHEVLRKNLLGLDLGRIRPELAGVSPAQVLPRLPRRRLTVRHTVGLGDPLTDACGGTPPGDGLPWTLEEAIRSGGLTHFKIKLCGNAERDEARLAAIATLLRGVRGKTAFTLDGNENYPDIGAFRAAWARWQRHPLLGPWLATGLLFAEQPLHRDCALLPEVGRELARWPDAPPLLIDEADASLADLPTALALGYRGTSHKNCKGVIKGLSNLALLRRQAKPGILSGEDLTNIGPVALLQDCAIMGTFGIDHVERNGHHYFRGVSMFPAPVTASLLSDHPDLFHRANPGTFPVVTIRSGGMETDSALRAPFGCATLPDLSLLSPGFPVKPRLPANRRIPSLPSAEK